jgi:hypothetical protein
VAPQRWNDPWTAPRGVVPERPPGEPGPGALAALHVAVFFGLSALGSLAAGVAGRSEVAAVVTLVVLFVLTAGAGLVLRRQAAPVMAWVADMLLAASVAYLFGAAGTLAHEQGASDPASFLTAALAALPWGVTTYVLHRRIWTQVATVLAFAVALQAALEMRPEIPDEVAAVYLLLLGAFLALLALAGIARPVRSAAVLSALAATAGARVLADDHAVLGAATALLVIAVVVVAVLRTGNRSLVPVAFLAVAVLAFPVLQPAVGGWQSASLALVLAALLAAWLAVDVSRVTPRPAQSAGVFAVGLVAVVVSDLMLIGHGRHEGAVELVHALAVAGFFVAACAAPRRAVAVVTGLLVLAELPDAVTMGGSDAAQGLVSLGVAAAAVVLMVQMRTWKPRPAAAPDHQEVALSGPGREWAVVAPYQQVFDAVVGVLSQAGVPLQLVDRAAGRIVAGDPVRPLLVVAVWAHDPVRSQVRAVGAPHDVDRLDHDVAQWVARLTPNEAARAT